MAKMKKQKKLTKKQQTARLARTVLLAPGQVILPSVPPVSTRATFQANPVALKNTCRSDEVPPTCYVGQKKFTPGKLGLGRGAMLSEYKKACSAKGGKVRPGYKKPIRAGKVELDFLSPAQAKQKGTLPGPNMRLCLRDDEPGYLVPVASPEAAKLLEMKLRKCTGNDKRKMPKCALKVAGPTAPLGGLSSGGLLSSIFSR